ncbi:MAG: hypothetical protein LBG96_07515 [Tannerella sp.]|jgi:hypothetical protein|nr:hypothetical protein [Tannerella sp.]
MTEGLNASYRELLHTPYQLLLMMQHDKVRIDYGKAGKDKARHISGKEMLKRKREQNAHNYS